MRAMTAEKGSRYLFIDIVRGIAASAVFIQHSLEMSGLEVVGPGNFCLSWLNLGEVGVVAFFLVSGFVIPLSLERTGSIATFWAHRAFRIYPLYLCVYFATLATSIYWGAAATHVPLNFLLHLFFVQEYVGIKDYVPGSWTLSLEACWYLGFTCLFLLSFHKRCIALVLAAAAASLVACAIALGVARIPMGRVSLLVVCLLGLLAYRNEQGDIGKRVFILGSVTLAASICANLLVGFLLHPSSSLTAASFRCVLLSWLLGGSIFFVPFMFRKASLWNNRPLLYLGKISYSVYLVHPLVLAALARTALRGLLFVGVAALLTLAVSSLTYSCVERPAIRFSHRGRSRHVTVGAGRV